MGRTTITTHFQDDSEKLERFEEYMEERGLESKSAAARALLAAGLKAERSADPPAAGRLERLSPQVEAAALIASAATAASALAAGVTTVSTIWGATTVVLLTVLYGALTLAQVALRRLDESNAGETA